MKTLIRNAFFVFVIGAVVIFVIATIAGPLVGKVFSTTNASLMGSGYSAPAASADLYVAPPEEMAVPEQAAAPEQAPVEYVADTGTVSTMPGAMAAVQLGSDALTGVQSNRMIIKNADVRLLVKDTDDAINRALQVVGDIDGYIISSQVWYQEANGSNYKYATITIGVPVDQFENAMRRLRLLAIRVQDENTSGQDVSDEYVDLQSQLSNLEATASRIRSFMEDTKTVEESLRINAELTNIEGQIEQVKGRMNYLANRSAYSTITTTFEPDIPPLPTPTLTLTPTITPTLTPYPTATPKPWMPGKTLVKAKDTVVSAYQGFIEILIWVFVVILPILLPPALIAWGIWKWVTRKKA